MPRRAYDINEVNRDLIKRYGPTVTRQNMLEYMRETGIWPDWIKRNLSLRLGRGVYRVPTDADPIVAAATAHTPVVNANARKVIAASESAIVTAIPEPPHRGRTDDDLKPVVADVPQAQSIDVSNRNNVLAMLQFVAQGDSPVSKVPERLREFVPFGDYPIVENIIRSRKFFPIFITGLSGNGKTLAVEQACANLGREFVRLNITVASDEDEIIGHFSLRNGETVFDLGLLPIAMLRGGVILLDEMDMGDHKIMCLQPVLEGKPLVIKKLGVVIHPAPGFQIFATANTKGRGDETGKFAGAQLMNEAMLERFAIMIPQQYPDIKTEKKILTKTYDAFGGTSTVESAVFFDTLAKWADAIRKTYDEGGIEDLISTRRLVHIVRAYHILGDNELAVSYCTNRFDAKTRTAFIELYNKLAPDPTAASTVPDLDGEPVVNPEF